MAIFRVEKRKKEGNLTGYHQIFASSADIVNIPHVIGGQFFQ